MNYVSVPIVFVIAGDLHLTSVGQTNYMVAEWMVDQVNNLIRPDFVQFIGDNVQHALPEEFDVFDQLRSQLKVPSFVLVGDHDVHQDPTASEFRSRIGETHGSDCRYGFRFIRVNTQEANPAGIGDSQFAWLVGEMKHASRLEIES